MTINDIACDIRIVPRTLRRMLRVQIRELVHTIEEIEKNQAGQQLSLVGTLKTKAPVIRVCHDFRNKAA